MKKMIRSPLFVPIVSAPVLFGIAALLLSLGNYEGPWYYVLYYLLQTLNAGLWFFALRLVFRDLSEKGFGRALLSGFPILISLTVYHVAIAFYDAYVVQFEEALPSVVYALLSLVTDAIVGEWLLFLLAFVASWLFFFRRGETLSGKRAAWLLSALVYFVFLFVGRLTEFISFLSGRLGIADEKTTVSFLVFVGTDLLISAFGYLVLFFSDRAKAKGDAQ